MNKEEKSCGSCEKTECSAKHQDPQEDTKEFLERQALLKRMCQVKHKVLVMSGKGGVGKSTVAVNMAISLAMAGERVGLLDVDVHGPSIPKLLNLEDLKPVVVDEIIVPIVYDNKLKVMSIGFFLPNRNEAVIWRGPLKMSLIRQFLRDVEWGELDYLVIDSPPGTGDEPLSVAQLIEDASGAVIVTTPQEVAVADVRRSVTFCRQVGLRVLGIIENMSGFICPGCGTRYEIFKSGGGESLAKEMGVPFLGKIPLDPDVVSASDGGKPFCEKDKETETTKAFAEVVNRIKTQCEQKKASAFTH